ncbi:hypothetical protein RIR_jg37348.t1 [Rhizophagus irregularis DAOM 181602=DAOM 197198]|nr:hypothetical protein RIR_jg37348.t1 [Rhizophagus irregularis DAOM 181602=DAOM 197198]
MILIIFTGLVLEYTLGKITVDLLIYNQSICKGIEFQRNEHHLKIPSFDQRFMMFFKNTSGTSNLPFNLISFLITIWWLVVPLLLL